MKKTLQSLFFEKILLQFHKRKDGILDIAKTLDTSRDSVYRRIGSVTPLTPEELEILAVRYKISVDALIYKDHNAVLFEYRPIVKPIRSFDEYLNRILKDLEKIYALHDRKLYYASSADFPIFFYFLSPELTSMKMYIWGRMMWDFDYLKDYPFDFEIVPLSTHLLAKELIRLYMRIPSVDVWGVNILENTLNQIDYMFNIGAFRENSDALVLCDKLIELIHLLRTMAEVGKKGTSLENIEESKIPFELYLNDIVFTNNTVLSVSEEGKVVFASFDNPNFLKSVDQKFGENTERWFQKLMAQSSLISVNTDRRRRWYFNVLETKVQMLRNRLALSIEDGNLAAY